MTLSKIIKVVEEKCVNCHQCISVCPSKSANDGSKDIVDINDDLCIGCGQCVKACTHDARIIVDDFDAAFAALNNKKNVIAIIAPAIAASFPLNHLKLNGWLKSLGVDALFDVSFGAELTVKSYLEHVSKNNPQTIISQPCPAIVTYIQIHKPDLIPYLAPAHSPMMHTVQMIKTYYPKYKDFEILVVSPCTAKKREIEETNLADYNVTFSSITKYINEHKIDINSFEEIDFDNNPAERATLFSSPGGLMETAEREMPGIRHKIRKIEGPDLVYDYLDSLSDSIEKGISPLIVDCLNCEAGCNGGTGTDLHGVSVDEMEFHVRNRAMKHMEIYGEGNQKALKKLIDSYWKPEIYNRSYLSLEENYTKYVKPCSEVELKAIYESMHKYTEEDLFNCASCGYNLCSDMAKAIHNNLNKKENCYHYNQKEVEKNNKNLDERVIENENKIEKQNQDISKSKEDLLNQSEELLDFLGQIQELLH